MLVSVSPGRFARFGAFEDIYGRAVSDGRTAVRS